MRDLFPLCSSPFSRERIKVRVVLVKHNIEKARRLRKRMIDAEKKLWQQLRNRRLAGLKFRRQYPCGSYYLDFYCPSKHLAIEIDGGQHYTRDGQTHDKIRNEYLRNAGIHILRYSNKDFLKTLVECSRIFLE
jgi:adenine-specific DNA-methyltransferase